MKKALLFPIFILFLFVACKKEADTTDPTITINNPIYGKVFKKGETISIKASIQDANLSKVFLTVYDDQTTSKVYLDKVFDKNGQTDFALEESWIANTTSDSIKIYIAISALDDSDNQEFKTTSFIVKK